MKPTSPVVKGQSEKVFAEDQPEYAKLPAIVCEDGQVITRWKMGWKDRLRALIRGDVYLHVHTYGNPLQPVYLDTEVPQFADSAVSP